MAIYNGTKVEAVRSFYVNNGNLAIVLRDVEHRDMYGVLTVNLYMELPSDMAFVDTNNFPDADSFIISNGLGTPTGEVRQSGYCVYPLYRFDLSKLEEL